MPASAPRRPSTPATTPATTPRKASSTHSGSAPLPKTKPNQTFAQRTGTLRTLLRDGHATEQECVQALRQEYRLTTDEATRALKNLARATARRTRTPNPTAA